MFAILILFSESHDKQTQKHDQCARFFNSHTMFFFDESSTNIRKIHSIDAFTRVIKLILDHSNKLINYNLFDFSILIPYKDTTTL